MQLPKPTPHRIDLLLALVVAAVLALMVMLRPIHVPHSDELRYITPAMNLVTHGVLSAAPYNPEGQPPQPTLVSGGPLIVSELALIFTVSRDAHDTATCILTNPSSAQTCDIALDWLHTLHWLELLVFVGCFYIVVRTLTSDRGLAWSSIAAVLLTAELTEYTNTALTEPLFLATYGIFMLAAVRAFQTHTMQREATAAMPWLLLGLATGLLVLIKPAAQTLIVIIPIVLTLHGALSPAFRVSIKKPILFVVGAALPLLPVILRNGIYVGTFALSDPVQLEGALAHRVAYNAMGVSEWFAAWVTYFPDFGDDLAKSLFGEATVEKLLWGPESYYVHGRDVLHQMYAAAAAPQNGASLILRTEVFGSLLVHAATSMVLFWRGILVDGYWGLAGLIASVAYFWSQRDRKLALLLMGAPLILAGTHAIISVSIPRYNLALIAPYGFALGWWIKIVASKLVATLSTRRKHVKT